MPKCKWCGFGTGEYEGYCTNRCRAKRLHYGTLSFPNPRYGEEWWEFIGMSDQIFLDGQKKNMEIDEYLTISNKVMEKGVSAELTIDDLKLFITPGKPVKDMTGLECKELQLTLEDLIRKLRIANSRVMVRVGEIEKLATDAEKRALWEFDKKYKPENRIREKKEVKSAVDKERAAAIRMLADLTGEEMEDVEEMLKENSVDEIMREYGIE